MGQTSLDSLIDAEIQELLIIWEQFDDINTLKPDQSHFDETSAFLMTSIAEQQTSNELLLMDINQARADLLHYDWGIDASASYLENFGGGADEDNLIYQRRFQTGLSWSILRNGYLANQRSEQILLNENVILQYESEEALRELDHVAKWHSIMYFFNLRKVEILQERLELVERRLTIANKLHYLRHLSKEDLLAIQSKEAEIRSMFNIYASYNEQLAMQIDTSLIPDHPFPLVDLNYQNVFKAMNMGEPDSIVQLRLENIDLRYDPIHIVDVKTNFRYNWYDLVSPTNPSRQFFSAGLTVSIPIPPNFERTKDLEQAEKDFVLGAVDADVSTTNKELLNNFYEFRYKLKQYTNFYEKKFRFLEQLRQERVRYKLDPIDFNPLTALSILDDILSIEIELIDLQQNMYLKVLNVYNDLPELEASEVMTPFELPNYFEIDDQIERSVYVWSGGLTNYSADFLVEYLRFNEIEKAVITANTDTDVLYNTLSVMSLIDDETTATEIMVGRNSLIEEDVTAYLTQIWSAFSSQPVDGIHLDVEPHTFDDWQSRKEEYLSKYQEMLDLARTFCDQNGLELSVSIPLHYPEAHVNQILDKCDNVFFMAYENIKLDYISKKVEPYLGEDSLKVVIALRTDDFDNRYWMEEHVLQLNEQLGVARFAIHDFSSMVEFDETIITDQE